VEGITVFCSFASFSIVVSQPFGLFPVVVWLWVGEVGGVGGAGVAG